MKSYELLLTESEMLAVREALDRYYFDFVLCRKHEIEHGKEFSPIAIKMYNSVNPLLNNVKDKIRLSK